MPKTSFTLFSLIKVGKLRPGVFEAKEGEESKEEKQVLLKRVFSSQSNTYMCAGDEGWQGEKCLHQDRGGEGLLVVWLVGHSKI